ncbi:MAG: Isocitrate dehydrogenase (NADP) [Firmicutes bacterium]|nr:Isocitrate dehydrogenase (NADP) [Bacillota bacterium]
MVSNEQCRITVARGDGIGPEIMEAALHILTEAGARIRPEFIEIGERVYSSGHTSGITPESWAILRRNKIFFKAPITTPQGGGFKSLNVTVRKTLGLYANVRPAVSYHPFIKNKHSNMNIIIVRENEEDLYAGIEHRQTNQVYQCLKLITRPGCEKIIRFAFEHARRYGRKKVSCFTKDNIMKLTDGLFHKVFNEIGELYSDIEKEHRIVDIGIAKLADTPEMFDVLVMPNLYGDIASDMAAQIAGSVGLSGSANIGTECAMFEAIHGSAPRRAGKGIANPSGLIHAAILMLLHIGQNAVAERIHNAWLKTIEDGIYTYDIAKGQASVGTMEFAYKIVERLGEKPTTLKPVSYPQSITPITISTSVEITIREKQQLIGTDVFIRNDTISASELGQQLTQAVKPEFQLIMITNRGIKVYPGGFPETFCTDHWRCRFQMADETSKCTPQAIRNLLELIEGAGLFWIKLENLYTFDGKPGFSLGQGQ